MGRQRCGRTHETQQEIQRWDRGCRLDPRRGAGGAGGADPGGAGQTRSEGEVTRSPEGGAPEDGWRSAASVGATAPCYVNAWSSMSPSVTVATAIISNGS